jgi:adenosylcobinamide-GDP ribazoletransferase
MTDVFLARWLPREAVAALLILVLVAMTRGLHQDGLADTLDGLAGGRTASDRLTIMRDPVSEPSGQPGSSFIDLRYGALVFLPEALRFPVLLCMPAIGRWGMVVAPMAPPMLGQRGAWLRRFLRICQRGTSLVRPSSSCV